MSKVSLIIPCLIEEASIGVCIEKAKKATALDQIDAETIIVDNGSTNACVQIADRYSGVTVVRESMRGYDAAYLRGLEVAQGDYIVMGDGDDTYDFSQMAELITPLENGYDMIIGSRFKGKILRC